MGNKAIKIKLTNVLRGKKRKNRYAKLNRGRWRVFIFIKTTCKGKRTVGKSNKGINAEKYSGFKIYIN